MKDYEAVTSRTPEEQAERDRKQVLAALDHAILKVQELREASRHYHRVQSEIRWMVFGLGLLIGSGLGWTAAMLIYR